MADEDRMEDDGGPPAPAAEPPKEPTEKPLTRAEFLDAQREMLDRLGDRLQPPPTPIEERDPEGPTDEDEGDTRTLKIVRRELASVRRDLKNFAGYGLDQLGAHSWELQIEKLPYGKKFEKEIRTAWNGMPPDQRANPTSVKVAHDWVVSQHVEDVANERAEEIIRQRVRTEQPAPPGDRSSRNMNLKAGTPSPTELGFTDAQISAVERKGGWDRFARQLGYKSYEEYAKTATDYRNAGQSQ